MVHRWAGTFQPAQRDAGGWPHRSDAEGQRCKRRVPSAVTAVAAAGRDAGEMLARAASTGSAPRTASENDSDSTKAKDVMTNRVTTPTLEEERNTLELGVRRARAARRSSVLSGRRAPFPRGVAGSSVSNVCPLRMVTRATQRICVVGRLIRIWHEASEGAAVIACAPVSPTSAAVEAGM